MKERPARLEAVLAIHGIYKFTKAERKGITIRDMAVEQGGMLLAAA